MRSLFMLLVALGAFLRPTLAGTEYKGVVKSHDIDNGERFAVVLPTGPDGTMELKKLVDGQSEQFNIEGKEVHKFKGFVCMKLNALFLVQEIKLASTGVDHGLRSGDTFTWEAGISGLSLTSEKTGKEVIDTWSWIIDVADAFSKRSKVDLHDLEDILK